MRSRERMIKLSMTTITEVLDNSINREYTATTEDSSGRKLRTISKNEGGTLIKETTNGGSTCIIKEEKRAFRPRKNEEGSSITVDFRKEVPLEGPLNDVEIEKRNFSL